MRFPLQRSIQRSIKRSIKRPARQAGFAYIAAIVLLVVMATMATAMVRLGTTQNATSTQDLLSVRATQAARAGLEWGLYRLRTGECSASPRTLDDFKALTGFSATVTCTVASYNEGESAPGVALVKNVYTIDVVACNAGGACPDNAQAAQLGYVERRRVASVCATAALGDCY